MSNDDLFSNDQNRDIDDYSKTMHNASSHHDTNYIPLYR